MVDVGTFGTVYRVRMVGTDRTAAVKRTPLTSPHGSREIEAHQRLGRHPNVVRLLFYYISGSRLNAYLYLAMEYAPLNIHRLIRAYADTGRTMAAGHAKLYTYQMFRALGYVHAAGLYHRDVTPRNLLVYPDGAVLKLCDFGSAKDLDDGTPNVTYVCTRHYRAPELLFPAAADYTVAVDVWSAGCVYAEMVTGRILYPGNSTAEQRSMVLQSGQLARLPVPADVVQLVMSTLSVDAARRPTALECCAHPCYDQLRYGDVRLADGRPLPPLFDFNDTEIKAAGNLITELLPGSRLFDTYN